MWLSLLPAGHTWRPFNPKLPGLLQIRKIHLHCFFKYLLPAPLVSECRPDPPLPLGFPSRSFPTLCGGAPRPRTAALHWSVSSRVTVHAHLTDCVLPRKNHILCNLVIRTSPLELLLHAANTAPVPEAFHGCLSVPKAGPGACGGAGWLSQCPPVWRWLACDLTSPQGSAS